MDLDLPPLAEPPARKDARRNYEAIVAAARSAFARAGTGAPLDDIARAAGVGPGTLYRRFPHRDDLIAAVLLEEHALLEREGLRLLDQSGLGAVRGWVRALAEYFSRYDDLPDAVNSSMHRQDSTLGASCARLAVVTDAIVASAERELPTHLNSDDVFLLAQGCAWAAQPSGCAGGDIERAMRVFAHGLLHAGELPSRRR